MRQLLAIGAIGLLAACAQAEPAPAPGEASAGGPAGAAKATPPIVPFEVAAEPNVAQHVWATGLSHPWSIAWLPDGRALVTERSGALRIIGRDGRVSGTVTGVPAVAAIGQGGLLDVAVDPDFARNGYVYLTHSVGTESANQTALSRGKLQGSSLVEVTELLRNPRAKSGGQHFGSRLLWLPDGTLLMSVGDGGNPTVQLDGQPIRNNAQNGAALFGKVLRLSPDGAGAAGNPGADAAKGWDARLWTMGHRNVQGLALDPKTGAVFATEHGARGGDELNRLTAGGNYGWPIVTYSIDYSGQTISEERSRPGFADPVSVWTPSIAASGLAVYRGTRLKALDGAILAGGLASQDVRVVRLDADGRPSGETRIEIGARVRDVAVGPDGLIYVLTDEDEGRIVRIEPAR